MIRRRIGAGSFGEVYEGQDTMIGRPVAIKVLAGNFSRQDAGTARLLERFKREARAAAAIHHPSVVQIHDIGVVDPGARPFMVMEFLEGHDLQTELKRNGPLAPGRLLPLFRQALEALGQAHRQGIVHKDLKPENLFLIHPGTPQEAIKIVDFGVAHVQDDDVGRLTAAGEFFATANYISPEYMTDQIVTPQMDVYQLGLILVELLMGETIVKGSTPTRCLMVHAMGNLEFPQSLVDSPLGPIVAKAVAFDHTERFADGFAFKAALDAIDPSQVQRFDRTEPRISLSEINSRLEARLGGGRPPAPTPATTPTATPPHPTPTAAAPAPSPPAPAPKASSRSPLFFLVVGLIAVLLGLGCLAAVGSIFFLGGSSDDAARPTPEAGDVATPPPPAEMTAPTTDAPRPPADPRKTGDDIAGAEDHPTTPPSPAEDEPPTRRRRRRK